MQRSAIRRLFLRSVAAFLLLAGAAALVVHYVTPWPSVWLIRMIFDAGAAEASGKLAPLVPSGVTERELVYDSRDSGARLAVYQPANATSGTPVIIWIHGGGFVSGRKEDIANYLKILAGRGFIVVNIDYTIAPEATYPTPVRQVNRALGFLANGGAGNTIADRRFVMAGDSAGAQLAAQIAAIITSPDYARTVGIEAGVAPERIAGALLYCGVFDVASLDTGAGGILGWFARSVTWAYSGKRDWRDAKGFETVSVGNYVTAKFPPTFISAGNDDPLAPQSFDFARKLQTNGVSVEMRFYAEDHPAKLGHEYQFDLSTNDGKRVFEDAIDWLSELSGTVPIPPNSNS